MTIEIRRAAGPFRSELVATAATFEDAKELARERWEILVLEDDADHADCADAYTAAGDVLAIQPAGFRL